MRLYNKTTNDITKAITRNYSTSFYLASLFYPKEIRKAIFSIYGLVRFADEIVDTFHDYDKENLLNEFESDLRKSLSNGISLNPILHAFQRTVEEYDIQEEHIDSFFSSMRADLSKQSYHTQAEINDYIYGSAEVVGLMCLRVFSKGDDVLFNNLAEPAKNLGAAFQKVNFLRDLEADASELNRTYFPQLIDSDLNEEIKDSIICDIEKDFDKAFEGIKQLPTHAKNAVLIAYYYYKRLLQKIKHTPVKNMYSSRIRVSGAKKMYFIGKAQLVCRFNLL